MTLIREEAEVRRDSGARGSDDLSHSEPLRYPQDSVYKGWLGSGRSWTRYVFDNFNGLTVADSMWMSGGKTARAIDVIILPSRA